jgi:hypothetical protein
VGKPLPEKPLPALEDHSTYFLLKLSLPLSLGPTFKTVEDAVRIVNSAMMV